MIEYALEYAARGKKVFPLHTPAPGGSCSCHNKSCENVGKHPRTMHGLSDATTDPAKIKEWWGMWSDANIGVCTGADSGFFIVDIDVLKGGKESIQELQKQHGVFPEKCYASTGNGFHLAFQHPGFRVGNIQSTADRPGPLGAGVDIRGDGGYIVAAPSLHENGKRYKWATDYSTFPPAPFWLQDMLRAPQKNGHKSNGSGEGVAIPKGQRDNTLISLAGTMRRRGLLPEEILGSLTIVNARRCEPPLPAEDVARIAKSAGRYKPAEDDMETNHDDVEVAAIAFPKIDRAAYFGLAGDIVRTISPHSEADPIALLVQTIVAFGNCVGRSPYFPVEGDEHHLNLSVVLVGDSSKSRKGTSWSQVRRPFKSVDEDWMNDCVQTGLSSGEGLIWAVRDPIEKDEPVKEKGRVTEYQTVIADHGVDDKRLLIQEPEFAKVLRVMGREGNTLSPVIRQAWDSGDLRILTKTSPARATDVHISIIGHITGEELRRNLDETESANGFANRILWVQVRRSKFLPEGGSLRDSDLNSLVSRLSKAIQHARSLTRLERDEEARQLWCEVYSDLSAGHSGLFGAITSRAEAQVLRLSCIYALLDHSDVIKRPHLEAALALWKYCEDSARFVFGQATGDRTADAIVDALAEVGDQGLTKTQLSDVFSRKKDAAEINRALALLQQRGLVASRQEQTEGRSRQRYFLTTPVAKKAKEAKKGVRDTSGADLISLNSLNSPLG